MAGFGAFGKIPAAGDFIRFGLSPGFVDPWDRFLQGAMTGARTKLGHRWTECYLSAPIWRFTLGAGQVGGNGVLGIVMPSVDRVGRRFPLTLAMPLMSPQPVVQLHFEARRVFEALEAVALAALEDLPPDLLKQRLAGVRPPAPCSATARRPVGAGLALRLDGPVDPAAAIAAGTIGRDLRSPGIWSAVLAKGGRCLIRDGLPGGGETAALFDAADPLWHPEVAA